MTFYGKQQVRSKIVDLMNAQSTEEEQSFPFLGKVKISLGAVEAPRVARGFFLIGIVGGGVHLGPLGTAATNRPIVPAPGDYDDGELDKQLTDCVKVVSSTRLPPFTHTFLF
jgi:hypothetical protein